METFYTGHTKIIGEKKHYFIKKFMRFPENDNIPDVLSGYGMHTDFDKACDIALVSDIRIRKQLLSNVEVVPLQAKLIEMQLSHAPAKSAFSQLMQFFSGRAINKKSSFGEPVFIRSHSFFRKINHH